MNTVVKTLSLFLQNLLYFGYSAKMSLKMATETPRMKNCRTNMVRQFALWITIGRNIFGILVANSQN
jgi:hypothetical protein